MGNWKKRYPVGASDVYKKTFTENDVKSFSKVTGDVNPVHLDEDYASGTRFGNRIVHGMYVASLFGTIFGSRYPGEGTIYLGQSLRFTSPVYLGETITAKVTLVELRDDKPIGTFETIATNEKGQVVIRGEALLLLP